MNAATASDQSVRAVGMRVEVRLERRRARRSHGIPLLAAAIVLVLAAASQVVAQTLDRAEIAGTIHDETGAALAGVTVTVRETTTGIERVVVTREDGRY